MFEDIKRLRSEYSRLIEMKSNALERAKTDNEKLEKLHLLQREVTRVSDEVTEYIENLEYVETAVIREAKNYQNRRVDHLNAVVTDVIGRIFPQDYYEAKLSCEYLRSDSAKLRLIDRSGNEHIPSICEGKCMQYLISFAAVSAITKALGCNSLFIDEAFGVASEFRLGDIGTLIQACIDDGMQLLIIAQNSALYNELKRHEIHLRAEYDSGTGDVKQAVVSKIVDV